MSVQRRGGLLWGRNAGAFPPVGGRKHRPTDGCSERAATTQGEGSLFCQSPSPLHCSAQSLYIRSSSAVELSESNLPTHHSLVGKDESRGAAVKRGGYVSPYMRTVQRAPSPAPPKSQFMTPRSSDFNSATRKSRVERGGEAQREWEGICWHRAAPASIGCRGGREGRRRRTDFILRRRRGRSGVIKMASGQWARLVPRSARSLFTATI